MPVKSLVYWGFNVKTAFTDFMPLFVSLKDARTFSLGGEPIA